MKSGAIYSLPFNERTVRIRYYGREHTVAPWFHSRFAGATCLTALDVSYIYFISIGDRSEIDVRWV